MKKICVSCVVVVLSVATLFGGKLLGSKQENVPPVTLEESDDIMESNPSDSNTDKMDNTNETQVSTEDNSEKNTETDTKESNKEENTDSNDIEENSEKDKKPTKAKASTETKEKKKQETSKPTESEKATKEVKEQTKEETPSSDKKQTEPTKEEKPKETEPATKNKLEEITSQKETTKTEDTKTDGSYANQVLQLVNQERKNAGLSALTTNKNLTNAANKRAAETVKSFSHTRPNGSSFSTVFDEFNINPMAGGENIAYGQRTPEEVVNAWMNSSGHRANILNSNFNKLGVGVHKENGTIYWSQLFTD